MGTTDNGYSAPPSDGIRAVGFDGAFAVPGVKNWDPVWESFAWLLEQYDTRIEWLRPGWNWGFAFRANANNPNALSRHSGAIAVDLNAPLHPNGVPTRNTFTQAQIDTIHKILDELKCTCHGLRVFRWGGDYIFTPDAMHFEIDVAPDCVRSANEALREGTNVALDEQDKKWIADVVRETVRETLQPVKEAGVRQTQRIMDSERNGAENDRRQAALLRAIAKGLHIDNPNTTRIEFEADELEKGALKRLRKLDEDERTPKHSSDPTD